MTSPWANPPLEAAVPKKDRQRKAQAPLAAPEPFAAHSEMGIADSVLTRALLPMLETRFAASRRLNHRGVADLVESHACDAIMEQACAIEGVVPARAQTKRSMEDIRLQIGKAEIFIDVKTRNVDNEFSMPNISSINRLDNFYRSGMNAFVLAVVEYRVDGTEIVPIEIFWKRVEEMCWSCLAIHNIGKGQLQIRDLRKPVLPFHGGRPAWMRRLHEEGAAFYGRVAENAIASEVEWLEKLRLNPDE